MRIAVFSADPGNHRFISPIIRKWQEQGIETSLINNYSPVEADVYFFDFVDNNLKVASHEHKEDLKTKKVIARLHAVEYYVGHYNGVDWSAVDDLIFVSDHMRGLVGKLPVKTHTIHNGIDLGSLTFKERKKGFNIAYAGNIVPTKGILIMFHYFKQLLGRCPDYRLHMVGLNRFYGREGEYYKHYLKSAELEDKVFESGEVSNIDEWLEDKDYLWQPSLAESFSIIVGEAMAKGIKPIINNFYGSEEIWPKELIYSGFDEFYGIIRGDYYSESYREYVKKYSLDNQIKKLNEIIKAKKL